MAAHDDVVRSCVESALEAYIAASKNCTTYTCLKDLADQLALDLQACGQTHANNEAGSRTPPFALPFPE